ncbi:PREDICTED: target of Myb protein 1-like [Tauraco erythrolophus]|uniref:target of Myb protein 1-like n=1 Tax=Tauraco erythrolophus TaxID=121530 RepID=UPI0005231291|nr:PREDICTED: target of Myb protein 1-like [Tauraco erythrolophus]
MVCWICEKGTGSSWRRDSQRVSGRRFILPVWMDCFPHSAWIKWVKYEDPQASKGLTGALDARQQHTGTVPVPQANFMEDIEKWLSTDVGEAEDAKGVTSEERAKVADRLPTLSSSSAETSVSPPAASRHRKQAKEDDAMFAL